MSRNTISTTEAAKLLGVARGTVQRLVDSGKLEAIKTPGGHRKISLPSVERMLGKAIDGVSESDNPTFKSDSIVNISTASEILVVEDSFFYFRYLEAILNKIFDNLIITHCSDGYEAFHKIRTSKFDLMILDINMPNMDGVSLIAKLFELDTTILDKTIILTEAEVTSVRENIERFATIPIISKERSVAEIHTYIKDFVHKELD